MDVILTLMVDVHPDLDVHGCGADVSGARRQRKRSLWSARELCSTPCEEERQRERALAQLGSRARALIFGLQILSCKVERSVCVKLAVCGSVLCTGTDLERPQLRCTNRFLAFIPFVESSGHHKR
eukprot:821989-Rhodomonas_salina.3